MVIMVTINIFIKNILYQDIHMSKIIILRFKIFIKNSIKTNILSNQQKRINIIHKKKNFNN